jgi:hypothetical protein
LGSDRLIAAIVIGVAVIGCAPIQSAAPPRSYDELDAGVPRGKVTRFGLFRDRGAGWIQDNTQSSTGKVIRGATLEFDEDTHRIPLIKGTVFGYRYWLKFAPDEARPEFTRVLLHPPMTLPDGSTVTRFERTIERAATYGIVTSIDAYALSEDYELVEGEWGFQLIRKKCALGRTALYDLPASQKYEAAAIIARLFPFGGNGGIDLRLRRCLANCPLRCCVGGTGSSPSTTIGGACSAGLGLDFLY